MQFLVGNLAELIFFQTRESYSKHICQKKKLKRVQVAIMWDEGKKAKTWTYKKRFSFIYSEVEKNNQYMAKPPMRQVLFG
jgi:hypothetical protein